MRRIVLSLSFFGLAVLLLAALSPTANATEYSYARIVRLSLVSGDVQINRGGHSGWEQAVANMPIEQGFTLGTNDGRAEVEFEDGATIWIAENTVVQFTELALSDGGRITHLTMGQGTLTAFANLKSADSFTVNASKLQASVPKRALFRVDAFHDGASMSVLDGSIEVSSAEGTKTVPKGETFAFNAKKPESAAMRQNPKSDSWDRWVTAREHWGAAGSAQAEYYASAPFSYGLADLSSYGSWNYFPGYGYGWQPLGMGNCWAPFTDGMWDFYPGLGWTWISDEPWGWVPYHFGNWNYSPEYGWMWMPGNFGSWNPAPVDWYDASNQVAWSPDMASFGASQYFLTGLGGLGGCGGMNYWQPAFAPMPQPGSKTTSGGSLLHKKLPVPPRLLLTTGKQFGRGGTVRLLAAKGTGARVEPLPAAPLENGRFARFSGEQTAANPASAVRVFVPTASNLSRVRAGLRLSANTSAVMPMRLPSAAMPERMPAIASLRNGAPSAPLSMPRPPSPVRFEQRAPSFGMGGGLRGGGSIRANGPSFSAPHPAPAAPAAHASSGGGKPH
jgi:hypothetical protein